MRAPDLQFDEGDHRIAREYVAEFSEVALGVKLSVKGNVLTNAESGSTYSICLTPGTEANILSVVLEVATGKPFFGEQSTWVGVVDPKTSQLHLIVLSELVSYFSQAAKNGDLFQGIKLDRDTHGVFVICRINMGWAEGVKLIKKVAALDKGEETFLFYRGTKLKKDDKFAHLHVHSYYSLLDGVASPADLAETIYLNGQPGGAITDHGSMMGTYKFWEACKTYEIKAMMGCEVYVVDDAKRKYLDAKGANRRFEYHQTLIAMNDEGWSNLCEIVSGASRDNYYYVPRTDHATIFKHNAGIICLSGCFKGMVAHHLQYFAPELTADCPWYCYNPAWSAEVMKQYRNQFGDRYYCEVHSNDFPRYMDSVPRIIQLADELKIPKVIANDAHFTVESDAVLQKLMSKINSSRSDEIGDGQQASSPYYLKCRSEITHPLFTEDMYDRTLEIMERCTLSFENKGYLFPQFPMQDDVDWADFNRQKEIK